MNKENGPKETSRSGGPGVYYSKLPPALFTHLFAARTGSTGHCVLLGLLQATLAEAVPEAPPDLPEVTKTTSASGLPPLSLDAPVVVAHLAVGVAALGASGLLDVVTAAPATPTQRVGLIPSFSETSVSTVRLCRTFPTHLYLN